MSDTVYVTNLGGALGYGLTGGYSVGQTLAVSATSSQSSLAAKTTVTATYATLASLSLAAGTWLVVGHASVGADNLGAALAASGIFGLRLFDGTNTIASCHGSVGTDTTFSAQLTSASIVGVVTLASTSTVSLQIDGSTTLAAYYQEQGSGATSGNATRITAVRIA